MEGKNEGAERISRVIAVLGEVETSLLERASGAKLLRDSLVGIVNHLSGTIDKETEEEIEGVIGFLYAMYGSLNHTARQVESCQRDLEKEAAAA